MRFQVGTPGHRITDSGTQYAAGIDYAQSWADGRTPESAWRKYLKSPWAGRGGWEPCCWDTQAEQYVEDSSTVTGLRFGQRF